MRNGLGFHLGQSRFIVWGNRFKLRRIAANMSLLAELKFL